MKECTINKLKRLESIKWTNISKDKNKDLIIECVKELIDNGWYNFEFNKDFSKFRKVNIKDL